MEDKWSVVFVQSSHAIFDESDQYEPFVVPRPVEIRSLLSHNNNQHIWLSYSALVCAESKNSPCISTRCSGFAFLITDGSVKNLAVGTNVMFLLKFFLDLEFETKF